METQIDRDAQHVTESGRVAIVTKYHGPTTYRGSRITVKRADGGGKRLTVGWDHALDTANNHAAAVRAYIEMMGWGGHWVTGATETGAVAVWAGYVRGES